MDKKRRSVIRKLAVAPILLGASQLNYKPVKSAPAKRVQFSVNAYSFNAELRSGEMTFYDMMEFAAEIGLDAVDLTGYYFSSYPAIPSDKELFQLKRRALNLGLNISWAGIRNNFANPDEAARAADREMVRQWLSTSSKLGASILRVFTGSHEHSDVERTAVRDQMVNDFKTCAAYAENAGVVLGLQNHNHFLFTSAEIIDMLERVNSEWFGLILDIGSLNAADPYKEIEALAPYANYWFVKERVYPNGESTAVDLKKIAAILKKTGYQGYVSIESLTDGDNKKIVTSMVQKLRKELA